MCDSELHEIQKKTSLCLIYMNEKGGKRPKGQMTGGANDLGAKDRGGGANHLHPYKPLHQNLHKHLAYSNEHSIQQSKRKKEASYNMLVSMLKCHIKDYYLN